MSNVIDLDILRPAPRIVKINNKEIDVSFIPCGITFDLDAIVTQLVKVDAKKVKTDHVEMKKAFDLGVKLCAVFCTHNYPEMTEDWFKNNVTSNQINGFANAIQSALFESYAGVGAHTKN